jgi:hypothetical protein
MLKVSLSIIVTMFFASITTACKTKASSTKPLQSSVEKSNSELYSMVITFFSIGTGVDGKTKKIFDEWVVNFEQRTGKKILIENYPWGREGEVDVCISLENFEKGQKKEFISEVKKIVSSSKLIRTEENVVCKRKAQK